MQIYMLRYAEYDSSQSHIVTVPRPGFNAAHTTEPGSQSVSQSVRPSASQPARVPEWGGGSVGGFRAFSLAL